MIESGCKECLGCGLSRQRKFEMCAYDGGETRLQLRLEGDTVWLTQLEIAELFQTTKQNVSLHARNIFGDQEMDENSVVKESLTTAADGKKYRTKLYNQGTDPGLLARQCGQVARLSRPALKGAGTVSRSQMEQRVELRYEAFDQKRRAAEARLADAADLKELEQLQLNLQESYEKPTE